MSKKSALGNIPTFNLGGSTGNINGIPIGNTTQPDPQPIVEEPETKTDALNELTSKVDTLSSEAFNEKMQQLVENERARFSDIEKEEPEAIEDKSNEDKITNNLFNSNASKKRTKIKKKDNRPSNKKHLKEGYTRQTFAVKDEQLELLRAIASYKGIEQKQLLEALLERAFNDIDTKTKEDALSYYNSDNDEDDLDLFY